MTESDRGKGQSRPPSEAETDARRNLSSGRLWLLGGVVILGVGVLLSGSQFPPGMCLDLIGVGAVILGLLRLIRGWVQRRMGER